MKKIVLLIMTISCAILLQAQENAGFKISFNHMALSIKDVNRSAAFYKEISAKRNYQPDRDRWDTLDFTGRRKRASLECYFKRRL